MPMGIISDSELESERNNGRIIERERPGRKTGDNNVPEALRKIISDTAITDGRKEALAIADMFGVSNSSTSAYARGATTTDAPINSNPELAKHNKLIKERISAKAQNKLLTVLDEIDGDKISVLSAVEASQVAKNLAGIVKDFNPDMEAEDRRLAQQQLVIFAPFVRREDEFPVINAMAE